MWAVGTERLFCPGQQISISCLHSFAVSISISIFILFSSQWQVMKTIKCENIHTFFKFFKSLIVYYCFKMHPVCFAIYRTDEMQHKLMMFLNF